MIIYLTSQKAVFHEDRAVWRRRLIAFGILSDKEQEERVVPWNRYGRYRELNQKIMFLRTLLAKLKRGADVVVVAGEEWHWALTECKLDPYCFLRLRAGNRMLVESTGLVYPLYHDGPFVVIAGPTFSTPTYILEKRSTPLLNEIPAALDALTEANCLSHTCDEGCDGATMYHFRYSVHDRLFHVGARRTDGQLCWQVKSHQAVFYVGLLQPGGGAVSKPQALTVFEQLTKVAKSSASRIKTVQAPTATTTSASDMRTADRWRKAVRTIWGSVKYELGTVCDTTQLTKGVWLCRDSDGGHCSSAALTSPEKSNSSLREMYAVDFENVEACRKMMNPPKGVAHDPTLECFNAHLDATANVMRTFRMLCGQTRGGSRTNVPARVSYLHISAKDGSWRLGDNDTECDQGQGPESLRKCILNSSVPDMYLCQGFSLLCDTTEWSECTHAMASMRVLVSGEPVLVDDIIPVLHLESVTSTSSQLTDAIARMRDLDKKYALSLNLTEEAAALGLCSLGEKLTLGAIAIVDRIYARQFDTTLSPKLGRLPISMPRGTPMPTYEGGLVIKNPNIDLNVWLRVLVLDFARQYPTIIEALGLSPDPALLLVKLIQGLLARRDELTRQLEGCTDELQRATLKARIKAVKLLANTVSGWLGNRFPVLAAKMTAYGRESLGKLVSLLQGRDVFVRSPDGTLVSLKGCEIPVETVFGDTDSAMVDVTPLGDTLDIPGLMEYLKPFKEATGLDVTPRELLINVLPRDGKRYTALATVPLTDKGEVIPIKLKKFEMHPLVTSSMPHTTISFPPASYTLFERVSSTLVSGIDDYREASLQIVRHFIATGLQLTEDRDWVLKVKLTAERPTDSMSNVTAELLSTLSYMREPIPRKKNLIEYVRVLLEDGQSQHIPLCLWRRTKRPLVLDMNYLVERFIITAASIYLALTPEGKYQLLALWRAAQKTKPLLIWPPSCSLAERKQHTTIFTPEFIH